ncbi:cell division initiation protein [Halanaerobium congolense]|uniref:Cell division initiation protein n=1 Tax=Halanaerobium congolense TaxID=54121 RepID=A0A1G6HPC3_9FIRM|nr:DivIVA domain-containing protein [Halanaerobium congolense]KXS50276.1 MAG: cell division initiation protein [Halanaerobium sp. T82-1]OEG63112.1 MAG: cell division protein DivIVA [Halanaerobium sp. MDAL1]PUU92024.1 MAG: cell division initiation protein [Halanaerobium sp.]PTX16858.1 cell division initiation protein [Halanaerobium congolense]TDX48176.1 cell division initiation protein [Halanaerobium congolense]
MKLNPLDIYNKEFKKSTFGYNTTQVDEFLDDVGVAYERLLKDLNNLQDENRALKEKIEDFEAMEDQLQNTLNSMQNTISDRIEQADNEARMIVKEARLKAKKIKENAHDEVLSEKRKLEQLREQRNFFKIRFQTLLESHLEMLKEDDQQYLGTDLDDFNDASDFELDLDKEADNNYKLENDFANNDESSQNN